jgi:hypothetical protein
VVDDVALATRAARHVALLRRLNVATLCVAVVVYLGLLGIAACDRLGPLAVFNSCIMLAEVLVFQIVRAPTDHMDLVRTRGAR